jgi:hypothetical protein
MKIQVIKKQGFLILSFLRMVAGEASSFCVFLRFLRTPPEKPAQKHPCKRCRREEYGNLKSPDKKARRHILWS